MRPDVEWLTPTRHIANLDQTSPMTVAHDTSAERQPTVAGRPSNVLKFPEERIRRIREQVAHAMAQVDPRVRQLRTTITLHEALSLIHI